ncbi:MAG: carboxymuconolactone decarboxylase family protein [Meiothermus sp.]|nr:carboxymuconolactone decarboxylase family protein [Meiothermus sp.]
MARVPYQPSDLGEPRPVVEAIRQRRGGKLLNLDRMLLHSPPYAMGWNRFLGAVRNDLSLSSKLRELAMCGVAVLNGAEYEFQHHAPLFVQAGGTPAQLEALSNWEQATENDRLFDPQERATLQLTFEMTRNVQVGDETFERVKALLPDLRQVVELVGVIAAYNMVSRFLVALDIEPE